ncbi:MAG: hypothetical protein RLZZ350_2067 [Verrucomicrobiota bacterium]|jgi:hypothetical protein
MKSPLVKAVVAGLFAVGLIGVAVYAGWLQWRMGKSFSDAERAPVTRWAVDFSTTNSYCLPFKHSCNPFYGTIYLFLKTTPTPLNWKTYEGCGETMNKMEAKMLLCDTNNVEIRESPLIWLYIFEHDAFPCAQFFSGMPEGEYVLKIEMNSAISELAGVKQELSLHYGHLYEKDISLVASVVCLTSTILGMLAARLSWVSAKKIRLGPPI